MNWTSMTELGEYSRGDTVTFDGKVGMLCFFGILNDEVFVAVARTDEGRAVAEKWPFLEIEKLRSGDEVRRLPKRDDEKAEHEAGASGYR